VDTLNPFDVNRVGTNGPGFPLSIEDAQPGLGGSPLADEADGVRRLARISQQAPVPVTVGDRGLWVRPVTLVRLQCPCQAPPAGA